ncbi:alpha/beta hydrolase [Kaistia algarum]|uniref:alpha/beta fold hydrolase n=1 Tax=Kaistia algarum TaxID=2083279 RepID=UPI000CE77FE8|nr:alpha/beta hydrolase [Kaistia algarum]MCX5515268.1 alpha/beta hydrolase [Kaistia algarum]PPE77713.1 alpha/beta hydrolase [Kaistia algarum]
MRFFQWTTPIDRLATALVAMVAASLTAVWLAYVGPVVHEPGFFKKPDRSGYANLNGIKMWYAIFNPHGGSPVILLHGGLGSSRDWRNQIPALVAKHMVILADSRGQGRSTRSSAPIGYDIMSSDVLALMDHLKIQKAAIVGWSDGGIIGLDIAIHHPERISKLFAYGANYDVDGLTPSPLPDMLAPLQASAVEMMDEHAETVREVNEMWETEPNFTPAQLRSIRIPTVIADGEREEAIKPQHTREMAKLIPGAKLVILPKVGHAGLMQDPVAFNKAMVDFLDGPDADIPPKPAPRPNDVSGTPSPARPS